MALQNAYEYDGTAMVPTKWIGIKLEPRCEVCEARGCNGHGKSEIELKAFCQETIASNYDVDDYFPSTGDNDRQIASYSYEAISAAEEEDFWMGQ